MKRIPSWLPLLLAVLGLLALSAVVWWLGPLLRWGDSQPLQPLAPRLLLLVLLWGGWAGWQAYKAWRRRRTNTALLQSLSGGPTASEKEAQLLAQRFSEAVRKLKARSGQSWLARLMGTDEQLYELPWYVFVGAPGSGKTTALMNAGLQFLLQDSGGKASVQGVGGTRNCEWWFTQDAVLIDTAGRYATQESDRDVDASAWDNFLALLKKTRPRQPINGVLLTVNIQDLLQQGGAERQQHAAQLRARLAELQAKLGVRAPVYVLVTKADLIGGFNESFEALDQEGRSQVWGFTFAAELAPGADPLATFVDCYQELQQRLVSQLPGRLQAERDVLRRSAIFAFPQEFAALRPVLNEFLRAVFSGGGTVEAAPLVRGVYFTSGTQEGSPIDRVMGALGRSFGMDTRRVAVVAAAPGRGKTYFLQRLLKDLVFAERGLGALNPGAEKRRRSLRLAGAAALVLLGCAVLMGWVLSRANNLDHAAQVAARLPALKAAVDGLPPATTADVSALPAPLAQVRDAAQQPGLDLAAPPLLHGLGLYQGDKLDAAAQLAYHRLLEKQFTPRVARRLEERLRAANNGNLEQAYEALKAYLMLHQPQQFDAPSLKAWIAADWDANLARLAPEARNELDTHLDAMLALGPPRAVLPKDDALVASVRELLSAYPLEYRVYSRIKRQYTPGAVPDFTAAGAAGPQAAQVFERASAEPLSKGISGLYTRDGYRKLVLPAVQKATPVLAAEEGWVLGRKVDAASLRDATIGNVLTDKVRRLYFEDYIKTWDKYLADVRLVKLNDPERALAVSRLLSAVESPLASYLRAVTAETRLVPPAASVSALDQAAAKAKADAARLVGAAPAGSSGGSGGGSGGTGGPLERMVDDHFKGIHRLVTGEPPPLNDTLKLFGEVYAQLAAVDAARKSKAPPPPGGGAEKVKIAAADQPEAVRSMLTQLADTAIAQSSGAVRQDLNTELKPLTDTCNRAITGRYPFASGASADVTPDDFGQVFGAGGLLDEFFQRRLQGLVDVSTSNWSYKPLTDGTRPVAPAALAEFQRAQRIREVFFRAGGKMPAVKLEMRLSEMDPVLKELLLTVDGQVQKLTTSGPSIIVSAPSARMASDIELSTGLGKAGPLVTTRGPWALFRLFENFQVEPGAVPEKFSVIMNLDGKRARLEVIAASVFNPFQMKEIKQFRCPAAL